jgi:hypothetical protein
MSATKRGKRIICTACEQMKQPIGRDASMFASYCNRDCPGYEQEPHVGSLWPGETDEDFGYPCDDRGTERVE